MCSELLSGRGDIDTSTEEKHTFTGPCSSKERFPLEESARFTLVVLVEKLPPGLPGRACSATHPFHRKETETDG